MEINKKINKLLTLIIILVFTFAPYIQATSETYKGIDISHYQGDVDFEKVKKDGIEMIYIKAGEGDSYVDPKFEENYKAAIEADLDFGFYYFVTAKTVEDARIQATYFSSLIQGVNYTLKPAMDFEEFNELSRDETNDIAIAFLQKVENITGVKPMIYSDEYNVETLWSENLKDYLLWVAAYEKLENPEEYKLSENIVWKNWSGYQYTDELTVDGILNYVDGDIFTDNIFLNDKERTTISNKMTYKIKKGDTLWSIGKIFDVTVNELVIYNNIENRNLIYIDEIIKIPNNKTIDYTVKSGDTLTKIAQMFNTTVETIAKSNNIININLIYVNEKLKIN